MASGTAQEGALSRGSLVMWACHLAIPAVFVVYAVFREAVGLPLDRTQDVALLVLCAAWGGAGVLLLAWRRGRWIVERLARRALVASAALLLSLGVAETALRARHGARVYAAVEGRGLAQVHPTRGWALAPGAERRLRARDFSVDVEVNEHGLRDVPRAPRPEPGVFRIVVLGDSFMEAAQVRLEDSLPRLLEAAFADRRVEVVNLGIHGYGTVQELLALEEQGLAFEPNLVLLFVFLGNDLRNNHFDLERWEWRIVPHNAFARPYAAVHPSGVGITITPPDFRALEESKRSLELRKRVTLERRFVLARLVDRVFSRGRDPNVSFGPYIETFDPAACRWCADDRPYEQAFDESWEVTLRSIAAIRDLAQEHDARFLAVLISPFYAIGDEEFAGIERRHPRIVFDRDAPHRRMREGARRHGFEVLDLAPAFRERSARDGGALHHLHDRHWTAAGHRLAAAVVADHLDRHGLVPAAGSR